MKHTRADLRIYGGLSVARIIALSTIYKFYCINSVEARLRARVDVAFSPRPTVSFCQERDPGGRFG